MFVTNTCSHPGCHHAGLSYINSEGVLTDMSYFCIKHVENPEEVKNTVYEYIRNHQKIVGLNASGLTFTDIDLSDKRFYGCSFQNCTFSNIHSEYFRARMSIFDYSLFVDCNLLKSNLQFSSFAGSTFSHVLFTGSDLVHNNFCGITSYQSSFDDSDLYNSRFIKAHLIDTSFRNCNIKKTIFYESMQQNISFKQSNTREAEFEYKEGVIL
ncbi:MAG: pentapeptide repeat-containing protein [Spirochaetaceae bacterium]|nr:pentapeptide repeat-containing protein [Spirochaetaceae bacterium]